MIVITTLTRPKTALRQRILYRETITEHKIAIRPATEQINDKNSIGINMELR